MPLELKSGDTFGDFRAHRVLRKHPHAWVYEVSAPGHEEPLDLKVSLDPVVSEEAARRALREVAVLGTLTNAHVVTVHDSGMGPNEHWYILMEHLAGAQLDHWHDFDVALPPADAVGFVHQACLGLAEVHAAGVVHRALEPGRLWVEPDKTLKIMDFSSARSWGSAPTGDNVTVGTVLTGSPQYSSPEQLTSSELTAANDVYNLGLILYELLSGHSPFFPQISRSRVRAELSGDPAKWLRAHASATPTRLVEHPACAELPPRLVELVHRCLAKSPLERPENASALANELGWILHHDLGAAQAAILQAKTADGGPSFHLVLPGSHRLGSHGAPLRGDHGEYAAILEWDGAPKLAEIVPEGSPVKIDDVVVTGRTPVAAGARVGIGRTEIVLRYPITPTRA